MAPRPHHKLTIKQLVKLSEERWNAARELAEILAELRERDESEAEPVIRSIVRRLSVLNYHPSQTESDDDTTDAAVARTPAAAAEHRRRRRVLLAAFAAAAMVAAWLLWPEKEPEHLASDVAVGLDLKARGAPADGDGRTAPKHPVAREELKLRRPLAVASDPGQPSPVAYERGRGASLTGRAEPPLHGSAAGMFVTPPPAAVGPVNDVDVESLGPNILNGRVRRFAEGGIYIGQARLRCYRTDSDPDACGTNVWGGNTRAGPIGHPRPGLAELRAAQAEFRHSRPPDAPHPAITAAGDPDDLPPSLRDPRRPPAQPPSGRSAMGTPPPNCPAPPIGRSVFILDGSLSMGLPLWVGAELEDQLDAGILNKDASARRRYRELLAEPGPKRITRAREAFAAAAQDLPTWVELGLVVFRECKDIRKVGVFPPEERSQAVKYVSSLIPRGRTPIAQSLRAAAEMLGDGPSSIILLTDGREFCNADPCAAAAEIHAKHPTTPISVIDISGQAKAECIASATGGRVYSPSATDDLARVLHAAFRGADPSCPMQNEENPHASGRAAAGR